MGALMDIRKALNAADVDMIQQMITAGCWAADPDPESQLEAARTVFLLVEKL